MQPLARKRGLDHPATQADKKRRNDIDHIINHLKNDGLLRRNYLKSSGGWGFFGSIFGECYAGLG